jgi:hypothetical protein
MCSSAQCQGEKHEPSSFQIFWAPDLSTARKIDDIDTVTAIEAARYRFNASMSDLERHYDAEASKLRAAFVEEVARLYQDGESA